MHINNVHIHSPHKRHVTGSSLMHVQCIIGRIQSGIDIMANIMNDNVTAGMIIARFGARV